MPSVTPRRSSSVRSVQALFRIAFSVAGDNRVRIHSGARHLRGPVVLFGMVDRSFDHRLHLLVRQPVRRLHVHRLFFARCARRAPSRSEFRWRRSGTALRCARSRPASAQSLSDRSAPDCGYLSQVRARPAPRGSAHCVCPSTPVVKVSPALAGMVELR